MRKAMFVMLLAVVSTTIFADTIQINPKYKFDGARPIALYGVSTKSCGDYRADREKDRRGPNGVVGQIYTAWFHGYVMGFNEFADRQVTGNLDQPTVVAYFDKWCRDNPLLTIMGAALCLVEAKGGAPLYATCKQ